ncbi:MAG: hypothetical protein M1376_15330 [Planctomycetes bacterium]|nr:hypothetical protein [Planctomycetota bacterium]
MNISENVRRKLPALRDTKLIALFNYYVAVAKGRPFKGRFLGMAGLSLSVAGFSFLVGLLKRTLFGVEV